MSRFLRVCVTVLVLMTPVITVANSEESDEDECNQCSRLQALESQVAQLSEDVAELQQGSGSTCNPVLFQARRSTVLFPTTADGETLQFDTLITDVGGGFDTTTGVFTAPEAGNYVFHANVHIAGAAFDLVTSTSTLPVASTSPIPGVSAPQQLSATAVLTLAQGDTVSVVADGTATLIAGAALSTFTGYRLC